MDIAQIDRSVGTGNGKFLGHIANGASRADMERRFKAGEFPDLNPLIAQYAMSHAGMGKNEGLEA